jgi:hypothetical protein
VEWCDGAAAVMASITEEAAVDPYCVEFCKSKLKVLGVDVSAAWKPKVRACTRKRARDRLQTGQSRLPVGTGQTGSFAVAKNRRRDTAAALESKSWRRDARDASILRRARRMPAHSISPLLCSQSCPWRKVCWTFG